MSNQLRVVTNSELQCRRRCAREHHYAYVLGYRSADDQEALRFGSMIHAGLEMWWKGAGMTMLVFKQACEGAVDAYEAARARVMLRGYDARWRGECHAVRGVEVEFRSPLVNPNTGAISRTFVLGGKIDVLFSHSFIEHKTTSSDIGLGSDYWRMLALNSQVSTYYAGARALGVEPEACIYDVLRKPSQRPSQIPIVEDGAKVVLDANGERVRTKDGKKWRETSDTKLGYVLQTRNETPEEYEARIAEDIAANPDRYYQRGEVVRLEAEEREAQQDVWQLTRAMREDEIAGRAPRNADACQRYGSMCPYFDVCTGVTTLGDTTRYRKVDNVHEELSAT